MVERKALRRSPVGRALQETEQRNPEKTCNEQERTPWDREQERKLEHPEKRPSRGESGEGGTLGWVTEDQRYVPYVVEEVPVRSQRERR